MRFDQQILLFITVLAIALGFMHGPSGTLSVFAGWGIGSYLCDVQKAFSRKGKYE